MKEAAAAFREAIAEAHRCQLPFLEMIARRDFITHVLDKEGPERRKSQMPALGRVISSMVMPAAEYTAVLGAGLDAEEAVAAFRARPAPAPPAPAQQRQAQQAGAGASGERRRRRRRRWRADEEPK
jgi:hypothetical protein